MASKLMPWRMSAEVSCLVCDRQLPLLVRDDLDLVAAARVAGCNVVGPDAYGHMVVQGCPGCLRYTTRREPGQKEGGDAL